MISSKGKSSRLRSRTSDIYLVKFSTCLVKTKLAASLFTQKTKTNQNTMPKARKSTRNPDAMDAEGHEEVRDVCVVFNASFAFFIFFFSLSVSFTRRRRWKKFPLCESTRVQFNRFNFNSTVCVYSDRVSLSLSLSFSLGYARDDNDD